ncbi:MAG: HDOD domain-containing protein [Myxococcales bacterium]|nr:HDOD domain-containing protein [Myxococcales bacterium]
MATESSRTRLVSSLTTIRPGPGAAQQLVRAITHADEDLGPVCSALASDPALAAEALRLANSPAFRRTEPVVELSRAATLLGLKHLRDLGTTMAALGASPNTSARDHDLRAASIIASALAPLVASRYPDVDKHAAIVASLVGEVGALACLMVDPAYGAKLDRSWRDGAEREDVERARFGATTWELGAALLERNHLPPEIANAVRSPSDLRYTDATMLARVTVLARTVAPQLHAREIQSYELEPWLADAAERAGLPDLDAAELLELCHWATESAGFITGAPV